MKPYEMYGYICQQNHTEDVAQFIMQGPAWDLLNFSLASVQEGWAFPG